MEIEVKFPVRSFGAVRKKLVESGAKLLYKSREEDFYFEPFSRKAVLRLRNHDGDWILTYKELVSSKDSQKAIELETHVEPVMMDILKKTGHKLVMKKIKQREAWQFKGTTVNLDTVEGIGKFIEIEFLGKPEIGDSVLKNVSGLLGLDWDSRITVSYIRMLLEREKNKNV